jgi:methylglutamate dehydrogenase subunit C
MSGGYRLESGGRIDRARDLYFRFDGRKHAGHPGDTLASALLASGVRLIGRSFKYHRPRGIFTSGSEEPNALVTLGDGSRATPNSRATTVELFNGLVARSQNCFPSLRFDILAANQLLAPFIGAGFYYKTFMWPAPFWERLYEPAIRRAAGLGALSGLPDPDYYERSWAHCDLLVIGSGPAGLMAALLAARSGARVILCEEDFLPGGRLIAEKMEIARTDSGDWAQKVAAELASFANVRIMNRTSVLGCYDGGTFAALERIAEFRDTARHLEPRQRLWRIVARRCILAAGALERGIAFADNDRPGIMLASAVRAYANRFGVTPGRSVVVYTCNDDGWRTARDLVAAGVGVEAIVEARPGEDVGGSGASAADTPVFTRAAICATSGRHGLSSVTVQRERGRPVRLSCDCLAVAGGWNPAVHLACHLGGKPVWNDRLAAFVPGAELPGGMYIAGAANGALSTHGALAQGLEQSRRALDDLGIKPVRMDVPDAEDAPYHIAPVWHVNSGRKKAWLDLQNDVTVTDAELAHREGFGSSIEHLKRYTTLGMATDQGKTANVNAIGVLADLTGKSVAQTGTTGYRPPYVPVAISALAGRARGREFRPTRLTPSHEWARENGAAFTEAGLWMRAQWFARPGETHWRQSCDREALAVRKSVGVCDVSTLGKIDVKGSDAATFLDRVYTNSISSLAVGKVRYGLMLREDGFLMDDGTVARLAGDHFVVTTTTANAGPVMQHVDYCAQVVWPRLDVHMVSVTDQYAQFAIAGPNSRAVLEKLVDDPASISNDKLPYMGCASLTVCGGTAARLFRISFSGELAFELAVPARFGDALVRAICRAGADFDITPYGLEALNVLRLEKGHPTGGELNGQTTAGDLGLARMIADGKDCIGKVMASRPGLTDKNRMVLVGFQPVSLEDELSAGAHLIGLKRDATTANDEGWVSSACFSPSLGHSIGLGFIRRGAGRHGETVRAVDPIRGRDIEVTICPPHFVDPKGERLHV